ncbi:DNA-binding protein [Cocleimonas sp. KMM 6892]|uniref:DNA-binding protein n=1 Tax=unclassified Cocleimonas TaxID=2639732 RepID=UPI002DBEDCA9|nr:MULTISPECIES: DNA-binding protein [unclassified Cocleimonas]MEB8432590.1 DNA-binding protein [Cocleimonas sp. KMM 6892]MEC4715449.1 DNA-binding protein [Cocleimonas sp. KMM 6895]MEC4744932.1 DNA-binding protein [Cocleimonas sp. KMM 6896]
MNKLKKLKTEFEQRGETISEWAEREGFDKRNVYAVISGRSRGIRGEAHKIAVRLGLKPDVKKQTEEK